MPAGAAVADQLAGVAPASQCAEAHAQRRRLAEEQPVLAVGFYYVHFGASVGELDQFYAVSSGCPGEPDAREAHDQESRTISLRNRAAPICFADAAAVLTVGA